MARTRAQAKVSDSPLQSLAAPPRATKKKRTKKAVPIEDPEPVGPFFTQPRQRTPSPVAPLSASKDELLQAIIAARDEGRKAQYAGTLEPEITEVAAEDAVLEPEPEREPQTPTPTPRPQNNTPGSTGWGLRTFFSRFTFSFTSPAVTTAAATTPAPTTLPPAQVEEIGRALMPVSTPTRKAKRHPKTDKPKTKKKNATPRAPRSEKRPAPARHTLIEHTVHEIELGKNIKAEEKARAAEWALQIAKQITAAPGAGIGDKRKRLDLPMKLKDVKEIPSSHPWQTGSYGLLDEFWEQDSSDEEAEAPLWYKLDQIAKQQPPLKKRKTTSDANSLGTRRSLAPLTITDSKGTSSSLHDLHPRPSYIPSPMFDNPTTHYDGANVFQEHQIQNTPYEPPARDRATFEKELKRTGHISGSGSFCVPEGDSDEDSLSEDEAAASPADTTQGVKPTWTTGEESTWTQSPPPAPVPAHASLPTPLAATPSVPDIQQTEEAIEAQVRDPFEVQRAKLMRTPAKPSRLREVMVPSPSLNSDAGGSPLIAASASIRTPAGQVFQSFPGADLAQYDDIPDPTPLDLGDAQLLAEATTYFESEVYQAKTAETYGGSTVVLTYDESEEALSDDEEQ